jgi:hypothetical protein
LIGMEAACGVHIFLAGHCENRGHAVRLRGSEITPARYASSPCTLILSLPMPL